MKAEIKKQEIELIKRWKEKPDNNIALYFFNKYKDDILNIIYSKVSLKYSSIPLEKQDFFSCVWKAVLDILKEYDVKKAGSFKNLLIQKSYFNSIREANKFLSNSHIILNNSYSYENFTDVEKNKYLACDGTKGVKSQYDLTVKNFIDSIVEFNKEIPVNYLKKIIYLKSMGCSTEEIASKLKRPKRSIRKVIDFICETAKKLYD